MSITAPVPIMLYRHELFPTDTNAMHNFADSFPLQMPIVAVALKDDVPNHPQTSSLLAVSTVFIRSVMEFLLKQSVLTRRDHR